VKLLSAFIRLLFSLLLSWVLMDWTYVPSDMWYLNKTWNLFNLFPFFMFPNLVPTSYTLTPQKLCAHMLIKRLWSSCHLLFSMETSKNLRSKYITLNSGFWSYGYLIKGFENSFRPLKWSNSLDSLMCFRSILILDLVENLNIVRSAYLGCNVMESACLLLVSCLVYCLTLKMEVVCAS
jgi:hypothetical protein